jgi:hypothetical protein
MTVHITETAAFFKRRMDEQIACVAQLAAQWQTATDKEKNRIATLTKSATVVFYRMEALYIKTAEAHGIGNPKTLYNLTFSNPKY